VHGDDGDRQATGWGLVDWEWDQPEVLRESSAALRVEGSEAGRGELGSDCDDVGIDQAELLIGGIVEEGPSLTHPGPQAGDGAGDCVRGLAGPVELGLPFGPGCADRYAGDVDFEQAAGVAAAPELREERDVVRDKLAAAGIEVGHAADVFGCADGASGNVRLALRYSRSSGTVLSCTARFKKSLIDR